MILQAGSLSDNEAIPWIDLDRQLILEKAFEEVCGPFSAVRLTGYVFTEITCIFSWECPKFLGAWQNVATLILPRQVGKSGSQRGCCIRVRITCERIFSLLSAY